MSLDRKIHKLTIKGFKTIRSLENFEMRDINVLIGANGSGKSNFISYFRMLGELVEERLRIWVAKNDYANHILTYGIKQTQRLESTILFDDGGYEFVLEPTGSGSLIFTEEKIQGKDDIRELLGVGHDESLLRQRSTEEDFYIPHYNWLSGLKVFHFHDTGETSGMKQPHHIRDNIRLNTDASNLAPYLYRLSQAEPNTYRQICKVIQLALPFFDEFILNPETSMIQLEWRQKNTDYLFDATHLSDGSLRFICLVTALMQPYPPRYTTLIIDEPELGLHSHAISLLGALVRSASAHIQIILATQSIQLINQFELEDLIVVEREDGVSTFKRLDSKDFEAWLEDYTIGELWQKNVLGGMPSR
ncbi:MAG: AAA family ATPase [bacterium]|nr:AAA family ATPase [bacterium]